MKTCTKCKELKLLELYGKGNDKDGLRYWCKVCHNKENAIYEDKNRDVVKARKRKYARTEHGKNMHRNKQLRHKYGIDNYDELFEKQNGLCAICKCCETAYDKTGNVMKLSVDHNHETGEVRKLLCAACNHGLGNFKDNILLLKNAIKYLDNGNIYSSFVETINEEF